MAGLSTVCCRIFVFAEVLFRYIDGYRLTKIELTLSRRRIRLPIARMDRRTTSSADSAKRIGISSIAQTRLLTDARIHKMGNYSAAEVRLVLLARRTDEMKTILGAQLVIFLVRCLLFGTYFFGY
jgi:hypothetical protein